MLPAQTGGAAAADVVDCRGPRRRRRPGGARWSRRCFCDVTASTTLGEELDPEALHGVMNRYFRELRATIERHGGTVEKFIGDAVMAVFGIPRVQRG